jgi:photosystem II stability/assembly factor-like uncharacterized protein
MNLRCIRWLGVAALGSLFAWINPVSARDWGVTSAPTDWWQDIASSADGTKLVAVSGSANFDPGHIYVSTNSGITWTQTSAPSNCWISVASSADGTRLAAGTKRLLYVSPTLYFIVGDLYTSTNSGLTWTSNVVGTNSLGTSPINGIAVSADGNKLAVSATFYIYTSTNAGATWTRDSAPLPFLEWNSIACSADGNRLVATALPGALSSTGFILTSTNAGATWTQASAPTNYAWYACASSADGLRLVAAPWAGPIFTSTNGGENWTETGLVITNQPFLASSTDGTRLSATMYEGGIYSSEDGGAAWTQDDAPDATWAKVTSSADGARLAAAAYGGGIFTRPPANLKVRLPGDSVPLGGIGFPITQICSSSGACVDVSTQATFMSQDTNVLVVGTNGTLTGVAIGSATLTVSAAGLTGDFIVTVRPPAFQDDFGINHDYLADGVTNTLWDGIYARPGDVPGTTYTSAPDAASVTADANISSNDVLTVANRDLGWDYYENDGFFLFKYVPGDFQAAVHLTSLETTPYNLPGLLARAYGINTNGQPGAPFGGTNGESWLIWMRFDEFGIGTFARLTLTNISSEDLQDDYLDQNYWLLMVRRGETNFSLYTRHSAADPWEPSPSNTVYSVPSFAAIPMQVGLEAGGFSTNIVTARFDHFMLDVGPPVLTIQHPGSDEILLRWPSAWAGMTLERSPTLGVQAQWQPVEQVPTGADGIQSVTLPVTGEASYFRLTR